MGLWVGGPGWPTGAPAHGPFMGSSVSQPQHQALGAGLGVRCGGIELAPSVPACLPLFPPAPGLLQLLLRVWEGQPCPRVCMAAPSHPSPAQDTRFCPCVPSQWSVVLEEARPGTDRLFLSALLHPGSKSSGSTRSAGGSSRRALGREEHRGPGAGGSGSESDHTAPSRVGGNSWRERPASQLSRGSSPHSQASAAAPGLPPLHPLTKAYSVVGGPPGGPPVRELATVPPELTGSRQSFQKAMGNPCEFFVDIM